ncbi:16S rRNA (cytidine(1402)-2'-O)-methyltransferase [Helicobacter mustelae]|uniref:Ribosomal RNA small subunit methyltransferase I n=1 Tax=Helicobacter mustelae (strain ATCC 43772 / CCUG 25715 / CIP 103759 / LMG 18044 / NCTC 12198 / R85-136P) TaxID=679897 RepID=D3UHI0_HELM1|nr:16S rRNA (cytidine(1402)-2'-O)-methyltransferase [Helicobacter mustelae]CBG39952.1 putative methylase [Helicobacter mustelae 12198]SQH71464.1 methylase [Helicobacter mustelae]
MITLLPTPIGNLGDVSLRMLEALAQSEVVLCEDTRVTKKLIALLQKNPLITQNFPGIFAPKIFHAFHSHNQEEFLDSLEKNALDLRVRNVVFLSDAGMPCINDPGALLVSYAQREGIAYDVLPGSNACVLAYCMSGIVDDGFIFGGFLPHKQGERKKILETFLTQQASSPKKMSVIFYESPHRILDSLRDLCDIEEDCGVFAIKEMSKKNQKFFAGSAREVWKILQNQNIQGEWVLLLSTTKKPKSSLGAEEIKLMDLPPKIKAKLLSRLGLGDVKSIYANLMEK